MKGFGIDIRNELLDPKHIEKMGVSLWLFMWCIDAMTSVNESGVGKVLGGAPIKYERIKNDLGIPERTYNRWLSILKKEGYINTLRTPYGLVITVNKAKKAFGKRSAINGGRYATNGVSNRVATNGVSSDKSGGSNKTVQVDNTDKDITKDIILHKQSYEESKKINDIIPLWEPISSRWKTFYKPGKERAALNRLLTGIGENSITAALAIIKQTNTMPYAPTITSPTDLESKIDSLRAFIIKNKVKTKKNDYAKIS